MSDQLGESGGPVPQVSPAKPPTTDFDRLLEYISERFPERDKELKELQRRARSLKLKGDVIDLGFAAIDFRRELSSWVALSKRLQVEKFADAMDLSHEERSLGAEAKQLKRPSAKLVETRAQAEVAPLVEVVERLSSSRDEMVSILSWCQSLQRALRDEEYGDILEAEIAPPERLYSAPIGGALRNMDH